MWKKAFALLASVNILLMLLPAVWYLSLPHSKATPRNPDVSTTSEGAGQVQLEVGQQAVNSFLADALSSQPSLEKVLAFSRVDFESTWNCDVGIKVEGQVVPFHVTFIPSISDGNLDLQVMDATIGDVQMTDTLVNIMEILPLPVWTVYDTATETLEIQLSQIPQNKAVIHAADYSDKTHLLTLDVSPKFQ